MIFIFSTASYAEEKSSKDEFISWLLPLVEKAKKNVGGLANSVPNSLVLSQAILESGWGKSPLAKTNKNLFGIKRSSTKYGLFDSYVKGIEYYLRTLVTHKAYESLREELVSEENPKVISLLPHLKLYSENPRYHKQLHSVIVANKLWLYDDNSGVESFKDLFGGLFYIIKK